MSNISSDFFGNVRKVKGPVPSSDQAIEKAKAKKIKDEWKTSEKSRQSSKELYAFALTFPWREFTLRSVPFPHGGIRDQPLNITCEQGFEVVFCYGKLISSRKRGTFLKGLNNVGKSHLNSSFSWIFIAFVNNKLFIRGKLSSSTLFWQICQFCVK